MLIADLGVWEFGTAIGFLVVVIAVMIVATILTLASRIENQAEFADEAVDTVREQTTSLQAADQVVDSAVRIMRAVRTVRKVAAGS